MQMTCKVDISKDEKVNTEKINNNTIYRKSSLHRLLFLLSEEERRIA